MIRFVHQKTCGLDHARGVAPELDYSTDSAASFGIVKRKGAGALKHLSVKELWIQEVYRRPLNTIRKIPRALNVSDVLCSIGNVADQRRHLTTLHFRMDSQHSNPMGVSGGQLMTMPGPSESRANQLP